MWQCPICETNNDDNSTICSVCGNARHTSIIYTDEPASNITGNVNTDNPDTKNRSAAYKALNLFFDITHEDAIEEDEDMFFDEEFDDDDFDEEFDDDDFDEDDYGSDQNSFLGDIIYICKKIFIFLLIVAFIALIGTLAYKFAELADKDPDIKFSISIKNAQSNDAVWYISDTPMLVTWSSDTPDADYTIELINGSGNTVMYCEALSMDSISISASDLHSSDIHLLRITMDYKNSSVSKEIMIRANTPAKKDISSYDDSVG